MEKKVSLVAFSKSRPWQLSEFLRTLHKFCLDIDLCDIYVIVKTESPYEESYNKLIAQYPFINWVRETDFENQLLDLIGAIKTPYLSFGCDDLLFISSFLLQKAIDTLESDPLVYSYHYRLDSGITFCHSANQPVKQPPFKYSPNSVATFNYRDGNTEFAYPFELTSSVYRTEDIRDLFRRIFENHLPVNSPNHVESSGYLCCFKDIIANRKGSCGVYRNCTIPTINRTQDAFANPIYKDSEQSPLELLKLFGSAEYDETFYLRNFRNSVHIGDFVLKSV